ncbi:MAG: hypothetical protein M0R06_05320 [Sphaerochaeta sp.]|nr:hypothetical protein [Sphaerochaeta sp.]
MNSFVDGCSFASSCDQCPFPECRASQKEILTVNSKAKDIRYKKVLELVDKGVHPRDICKKVGYKDTGDIYRIIRDSKQHKAT